MVIVQVIVLFLGKEGLCLNQGCQVVDQLTKVSPLVFNIAGLFFFQAVFWGLYRVESESENRVKIVRLLLLAGIAAEGVLVGFQQFVAGAFCTYCLIVFGFIVLLNLLAGIKQLVAGALLFGVVFLAFASLEYNNSQRSAQATKEGVFASKINSSPAATVYLFFSSTCNHCQRVLEVMRNTASISMHFNPIDTLASLDVSGAALNPNYSPAANKALLASLGIDEIPVLLARTTNGFSVIKGESASIAYLDNVGKPSRGSENLPTDLSNTLPENRTMIPPASNQAEGCLVISDCDSIPLLPGVSPAR
jgi:hypothetical protein